MRPSLLIQPYRHSESAATLVTQALADPKSTRLLIATAWLRASGLHTLAPSIKAFKDRGGNADLFVGLDYRGTTVQGLNAAVRLFDRIFVVHDIEGRTFHPKIYFVRGRSDACLLIGSNNLTAGGIGFNYEAAIVHMLDLRRLGDRELAGEVEFFATRLMSDTAICKRLTPSFLKRLDREGWLGDESKRTGASKEDAGPARTPRTGRSPIFARSQVLKRTKPIPPAATSDTRRRRRSRRAPLTPDTWWKQLNNTDVQRPSAGNPVGAVRITRPPGLAIDPSTFFRQQLFANETWRKRQDHSGNQIEIAELTFDCYLERRLLGTKRLRADYGPHRARRSRATTLLHWDELADLIHRRNFKDWFLLVERGAGSTHRLTLTRTPPA